MDSGFHQYFLNHPDFQIKDGLFYERGLSRNLEFETMYMNLRRKEGRVYADNVVKGLPGGNIDAPLGREWRMRQKSVEKLASYILKKKKGSVLEVGCGNGWLTHYLSSTLKIPCCGVDVNEQELLQAARVFKNGGRFCYVRGDIMSHSFDKLRADVIVLAASVQYFNDITALVRRLLGLLCEGGEIHIIDSPLYADAELGAARRRSKDHFVRQGFPGMEKYYHQHAARSFRDFNSAVLHDPNNLITRIKRIVTAESPFPWIRVMVQAASSVTS